MTVIPVAPVVQLVTSKPSDVGTRVRISVQARELGFFLTKNKIKNHAQQVGNDLLVGAQQVDSTIDEGKGQLNHYHDKKLDKHRRRKVEKSCVAFLLCVTPAGASTSLTSRINGMTTYTQRTR